MSEKIRVLVLGTGNMGSGIARLLLQKEGVELVGVYARRAGRAGSGLGGVLGLDHELGITISNDLSAVIAQSRPHIAIQATCSLIEDAAAEITTLLQQGVSVISTAEEMAFPTAASSTVADELHQLAIEHNAALLGTGINPGFVLDLLVIALTGVCADIRSISATRINDLSPYGHSVLASQGVGLSPQAFNQGLEDGSVVGHIGFVQSIHMIAAALGWEFDRIEERREPIISSVRRETPLVIVEPGQVAGCHHTAVAYRQGRAVITLNHPQQIHPQLEGIATGDSITIEGSPDIHLSGTPEIPGGEGTCALMVNMIPRVLNAAPGLTTMAELPVPAAMLGDARRLLKRPLRSGEP
jgi:4-hydroxy-tetrahydrodipicolinate reductase